MKNDELDLRERTFEFARRVIRLYSNLARSGVGRVLGDQILRSGTSVGANYREAFRARSRAEFASKMGDCLKELEETAYWIELIESEKLVTQTRLLNLKDETGQLIAIFVSSIRTTRANPNRS